jgi:hypothetical protein
MDLDAYDLTASCRWKRAAAQRPRRFSLTFSLLGRAVKVIEQQCFMLQCMSPVLARLGTADRRPGGSAY